MNLPTFFGREKSGQKKTLRHGNNNNYYLNFNYL